MITSAAHRPSSALPWKRSVLADSFENPLFALAEDLKMHKSAESCQPEIIDLSRTYSGGGNPLYEQRGQPPNSRPHSSGSLLRCAAQDDDQLALELQISKIKAVRRGCGHGLQQPCSTVVGGTAKRHRTLSLHASGAGLT